MQIAGYKFHLFRGPTPNSSPGIFIYTHQKSGMCFVRAMRNIRMQRGRNNYPTKLKELLKTDPSEVTVYVADVPRNTKEMLHFATRIVSNHLSMKGTLYKDPKPDHVEECFASIDNAKRFTIWELTHRRTGAVFYFEEIRGVDVLRKIWQRLRTFNNCVEKNISATNRVMYHFTKKFFPLDLGDWEIKDFGMDLVTEKEAAACIATTSKKHLEEKRVVLNRIHNTDALYYRNTVLKLPHIGIEEYLG